MAKRLLNLDDLNVKRGLMSEIGSLRGLWDMELKQRKQTRTLDQNKYYWIGVVSPFADWLRDVYGEPGISNEQAHEMLKYKILGHHSKSIDGVYLPNTTTVLDTKEFSDYIESCAEWLAEFCSIVVIPSDLFYQGATESKPKS